MSFKYSIAYPDKKNTFHCAEILDGYAAETLVHSYTWNEELKKEIKYYSPTIEIVCLRNSKSFALSGLGENKLEAFYAMFVVPKNPEKYIGYDEKNYKNGMSYSKKVSIENGYNLLGDFLNEDYKTIKKELQIGGNKKVDFEDRYLVRILGPIVSIIFSFIAYGFIASSKDEFHPIVLFFIALPIIFIIGTIRHELRLRK